MEMSLMTYYGLLKLNRLIKNHRVKGLGILLLHALRQRHLFLRFDPISACNLRCQMCYYSNDELAKQRKGRFSWDEIQRIADVFFPYAYQVYIGCGSEPTVHKDFDKIVSLAKQYGVPSVGLVTNGMLLTPDHVASLVENQLSELVLSVHGVHKDTYETLMARAEFRKLIEVLSMVHNTREERKVSHPELRINYTVNPDNLEELMDFFCVFGTYKIDTLQIRPVKNYGGVYQRIDLSPYLDRYREIVDAIRQQCKLRGVRLLSNTSNPTFSKPDPATTLLEHVAVHISPNKVWRDGYNWKVDGYYNQCHQMGWSRDLLRKTLISSKRLLEENSSSEYQFKKTALQDEVS